MRWRNLELSDWDKGPSTDIDLLYWSFPVERDNRVEGYDHMRRKSVRRTYGGLEDTRGLFNRVFLLEVEKQSLVSK